MLGVGLGFKKLTRTPVAKLPSSYPPPPPPPPPPPRATTIGCCYKRQPVQVLQDQCIQRFILPDKYQTVEPAARRADNSYCLGPSIQLLASPSNCWNPRGLQGRDFSSYTAIDPKMFYPVFSLLLTSLGPLAMNIFLVFVQCDNARFTGLAL